MAGSDRTAAAPDPLLPRLGPDERTRLLAAARRRRFRKGDTLFHEGDPGDALHLVEKGHVAIQTTTPLGDVATLTVLGPGEVFGEQALLAPEAVRTASAVALEPVETRSWTGAQFEELRASHPQVDRFLVEVLAEQVRRLSSRLQEALYVPAETRVRRRVAELAASYRRADGSCTITVTQDDIAAMAGTSRPTVNRVLQVDVAAGLLALGRGRIDVQDVDELVRRAP